MCLNINATCTVNATGCLWNDGHNTCMQQEFNDMWQPIPLSKNQTISSLKRKLETLHSPFSYTSRIIAKRKTILGTYYVFNAFTFTNVYYCEVLKRNEMLYMRIAYKQEDLLYPLPDKYIRFMEPDPIREERDEE